VNQHCSHTIISSTQDAFGFPVLLRGVRA
jgi:hypothetical protein